MLAVETIEPDWPVIPATIDPAKADSPEAKEFLQLRRELIQLSVRDPLRYGYEPPIWKLADQQRAELRKLFPKGVIHEVNLGGNRAAKSKRAAKRVVQACIDKPGSRWWCGDATEKSSRSNQQRLIWEHLPAEWRNEDTGSLKRTKTTKIKYSVAGGFTENILVMPNGSEIEFKFYEQQTGSLQAVELDGFWGDELLPLDWIETLEYRLVNRNGIFHLTFTPVLGYTPTVAFYRDDARTIEEVRAELLPKKNGAGQIIGHDLVPRIQYCKDPRKRVIYFHTADNPFGNYEGMREQVRLKSRTEIEMRVYGICSKAAHTQFPTFKDTVHVISTTRFKQIMEENSDGPRFHLVDPCSGRNWFMLWVYFWKPKHAVIYREWPSTGHTDCYVPGIGDPGPWAIPSIKEKGALDGDRGSAQEPFGFGLERYRQEILRVENKEAIFERWMDSRYGNSAKTEREGTTTLIQQMNELDMEFAAATAEKSILGANDGSIDLINSMLDYDDTVPLGDFSPRSAPAAASADRPATARAARTA